MTSDEAIKIFNTVLAFGKCDCSKDKIIQAFDMAIEALREHQHYKDLAESYEKTINKLTEAIAEQQPRFLIHEDGKMEQVNPQQKTGHWIEHKHGGIEHIECSKCHVWFLRGHLTRNTYCPECGSYNGGTKNE